MSKIVRRMLRVWTVAAGMAMAAAGCSSAPSTVGVAVVGVNYTDDEYSLLVDDPTTPSNTGSSGGLSPFSAGGQMCCFALPEKWHPGIKIEVTSSKSIIENGQFVRDDNTTKTVELPPYTAGEPGTLWVLQFADGQVDVISSTLSPEHPQWPGKVKGWPVPSLAYRTKIWKIYYDQAVSDVALFDGLVELGKRQPVQRARDAWRYAQKNDQALIDGFSGPEDPRFVAKTLADDLVWAEKMRAKKKRLEEGRPK